MAYAHVSEACGVTLEGSTPSPRTKLYGEGLPLQDCPDFNSMAFSIALISFRSSTGLTK